MFKLFVVPILLLSCKASGSPEGSKILEDNLKELKSIIDPSKNPCADFMEYACGNLKEKPENLIPYPYQYSSDSEVEESFLNDENITSKAAMKAKDYFKSCELAKPKDLNCYYMTSLFFRSVLISEFYQLYYMEEDHKIDVSIYEEFLKSFDNLYPKYFNLRKDAVKREAEKFLVEMKNIKDKLNRNNIGNKYTSILIDVNNFDNNHKTLLKHFNIEWYDSDEELIELFSDNTSPHFRFKPLYYHFAVKSCDLWESLFVVNSPKYNYNELAECVNNQTIIEELDNFLWNDRLSRQLASMIQGFRDFERALKSTENYDAIYEKFELTPQKSFFLSAAQGKCAKHSSSKNDLFNLVFFNMDEFYKTFGCPNKKCFNIL